MKFGMNLLLYTTQPDDSIFPICDRLVEMGFGSLEWPILATDHAMADKIRKYNEKNKLEATTVYVFGPNASPISPDETARAEALRVIQDRIDVTAELGGHLLCGPIVQTLGAFTGKPRTEEEWGFCVDFLRSAGDYAATKDVTLAVEYLNRFEIYFLNTAADAAKLCDAVGHPFVKTMIDTFHANIEEKNLGQAVHAIKNHLAHVHISENDRGVPGSGDNVDWESLFTALKKVGYAETLTIESFGQALPDLAAAAKIWRSLFENTDDVPRDGLAFMKRMAHTPAV